MITITVLKNPFNYSDKEIHTCEYIPGKTAYQYVQPYIMGLDDIVVSVSGKTAEDAKAQIVNYDDWIAVCPVVGKGSWFKVFTTLLIGGLAGGISSVFTGAKWGTAFWGGVLASGASLIGGTLINHWFPPAKPDIPDVKPSYSWNNTQALAGQGNALAVTYGTMRTAGQVISQHVSSSGEKQYLNILLCGGEGPIDSISDIRINGNPVSYYKDVIVETRLGVNDQSVIVNFNDSYADQALAYELDNNYITQRTEGNAVQGLEITLQFPYGLYYVKNDGSLGNASVTVQAQYRQVGGSEWTNLTNGAVTITKATNTAFQATYRVDNLAAAQYEVRAMCLSKSGTTTRYATRVFWTQLSSIMYDDFARPGKVLVGIKALATNQLSGSSATVTWLQTRSKVWVWNPNTAAYEQKSATNPAWAAYDMIHRCRRIKNINTGSDELVAQGSPAARMVYEDFANWAAFCDSKSLTFNYIFTTASDLWTALQKPESVGRGKVIMRGTRFGCVCDAPSDPVQLFTVGNIITDKFQETFMGLKDRANAIEITFANKDKGYDKDVVTVYADNYDSVAEPNITQITLDGATTVEQVYREGKYRLRLNQYLQRTVDFSADIDAIACQINDVVLLAHDVPQWGYSGRLLAVSPTTLQFDREVKLEPGKSYVVAVQITNPSATASADAQSIVTVRVKGVSEETSTDTITLANPLPCIPQKWDLYSFGQTNKVVKPFRVINISRDQDLRRKISCIEYIEAVYTEATDIPEVNYSELETVTEVSYVSGAEETYRQKDGTIVSNLNVSWGTPRDRLAIGYKVLYSMDNGQTWREWAANIQALSTSITGVKTNAAYLVKVCTINTVGVVSAGVIAAPVLITGKDAPPSDVAWITAVIDPANSSKIHLTWSPVDDIDLCGYRLTESGKVITPTPISDTQYIYTATQSRQHTFSIRAVDNSGNESEVPATVSLNVTKEPVQVTGFAAAIEETDRSKLRLSWEANKETDIAYYEIRTGDSGWNTGTVIATQLKATSYAYQLTAEGSQTYMVKAVNIAGDSSIMEATITVQVILRPDAPADLTVVQDPQDRSKAVLSWTASPGKDIDGYQITINGQTYYTRELSYRYNLPASGIYNFSVRAKNVAAYYSHAANLSIAATVEPYDVTGFTAEQNIADRSLVTLKWDPPLSKDVAYFEIRQGSTGWDTATIIADRAVGTSHSLQVLDENPHTYYIQAVSIAGNYSQNAAETQGIFNLNPDPVSNIQISQNPNDRSQLMITWDGISESDLAYYDVRIGYEWDTAAKIGETKETRWTYQISKSGDYKVMIKAKNAAGFYSDETYQHYYATVEPGPVTGFVALQNGEYVELYWDKHSEPDVVSYEIVEGASFTMGQLVATGVTTTGYSIKVDTERQYQYHIKAINRALQYSQAAAAATLYVRNLPAKNIIKSFDEITLQTGTKKNVEFGPSLLNFQTLGGRWSDYPTTKFSDVGGQMVLALAKNGNVYYPSGVYQAVTKDLGQVIAANVTCDFRSTVLLRGVGSAVLQIRTSQDGTNWTAWQDFKPAQYTFRYLDARVVLTTEDTSKTPEVNHLEIRIDVPDTDICKTVTVSVGGVTIPYGHEFYTVPAITPTAVGANRFVEMSNKTTQDVFLQVVDRTGLDVGGSVDLRIKGY